MLSVRPGNAFRVVASRNFASKMLSMGFLFRKPSLRDTLFGAGIHNYEIPLRDTKFFANVLRERPETSTIGLVDDYEAKFTPYYALQVKAKEDDHPSDFSRNNASLYSLGRLNYLFPTGLSRLLHFRSSIEYLFHKEIKNSISQSENDKIGTQCGFTPTTTHLSKRNNFLMEVPIYDIMNNFTYRLFLLNNHIDYLIENVVPNIGGAVLWNYYSKLLSSYPEEEEENTFEPETKILVKAMNLNNNMALATNAIRQGFDFPIFEDINPFYGMKVALHKIIPMENEKRKETQVSRYGNSPFKEIKLSCHPFTGRRVSYNAGILKNSYTNKAPKTYNERVKMIVS